MRTFISNLLVTLLVMTVAFAALTHHRGAFWIDRGSEPRDVSRLVGGRIMQNGFVIEHVGGRRERVTVDVVTCRYWTPLRPLTTRDRAYWPEGTVPLRLWLPTGMTLPVFPGHCPVWWRPAIG